MVYSYMIKVIHGDCLQELLKIEERSINLIIIDPPYGRTHCKWDSVIPMDDYVELKVKKKIKKINIEDYISSSINRNKKVSTIMRRFEENKKSGLWSLINRVIKPNGTIVIFSQSPFTSYINNSNINDFKHEIIYEKPNATGFLNANRMPLRAHENISIFCKKKPTYNPQKTTGHIRKRFRKVSRAHECYNIDSKRIIYDSVERFPRSVIKFPSDKQKQSLHPTQKPVELLKWLVSSFSNEKDLVLDFTAGSFTTGVACKELNRKFIGIEKEEKYILIGKERLGVRDE